MDQQEREYEKINVLLDIVTKAKEGDAIAQLELGKAYLNTTLVENNLDRAFKWILRSAEQGNMEAQFRLGNLYVLDRGTIKDFSNAYKWYTKAAIQGYKKALIRIHNMYQEDIRMHCRGQLHSDEEEWASERYKKKNNIRELYEYRLEQNKPILNGAIEYFTSQFKYYQSSDQENPIVQLNMAFLYQHGYGVKKCTRWAFEFYELAAEQGNIDAQYNLGYLYQKHTIKKFSYRHAFKWYAKSAQGGNIAAQRCLAYFYLKGLATDIDYELAISWYTKAANAGDAEAQVTLGKLYRKGDYIKHDLSMAVKWYSLAAREGNRVAQNCLSQLYQRGIPDHIQLDISEYLLDGSISERLCSKLSLDISKLSDSPMFKQLSKLAKRACIGDGPAMYEIGFNYYHGDNDFKQDKDTGIKWIKKAANAKHKEAQFMLAGLYKKGDSIEQDYYKAAIWYKKLSKEKDAQAQCHVGVMYNEGLGVRKDSLEASKWFIWAADQENSDAQYHLGMLRYDGRGICENDAEAVKWLFKSVRQKNIHACYQLGHFYDHGFAGLEINEQDAFTLIEFAARKGLLYAQICLGYKFEASFYVLESIKYFTMAADSGDEESLYKMAIVYFHGNMIKGDYINAYNLFKQAKDNGHSRANSLFQIPIRHDICINDYSKVLDMFTKVTEKGIDDLSYHIGCLYRYGIKDPYGDYAFQENYMNAKEWFLIASKNGDSRADYRLGIMYECGKGVEKNVDIAVNYYNRAIERESSDAMYRLACMYLEGYLIAQDLLEAFRLFTMASTKGHQKAIDVLTVSQNKMKTDSDSKILPEEDPEIPVKRENRIRMLEKATEEGHIQLQYQLGLMYEQNSEYSKAFKWLSLAANLGIVDAYYRVGVFYEEGRGIEQNYTMAADMYQKATEKYHEDACYRLGQLYQYGNGVQLDYLKAYDLYKKADEMGHYLATIVLNITLKTRVQVNGDVEENAFHVSSKEYQDSLIMYKCVAEYGNTEAQFKVGFTHEYNYSEPNYAEAFKWYYMAANNSHKEAIYHLGILYENGLGVSQDYHKAIQLYNQAYQLGSNNILHRLAIIYHHGKGVDVDPKKAIDYYTLSAEFGNPEDQCELGRLYEEGKIVQRNLLETLKWYTTAYAQGYDTIGPTLRAMYEDNKPYEKFFYERLVGILSVASWNYFGLNENYMFDDFAGINNRLGLLYFFGLGTKKSLKQAFHYFSREYNDTKDKLISHFNFLLYDCFSISLKNNILNEFETNEEFMNQLEPEKLYALGMIYYDGLVRAKNISFVNEEKGYAPVDNQDPTDPSQYLIVEQNHLKAFKYMKKAADNAYYKAMEEPVLFHYRVDIEKDSIQSEQYFSATSKDNITILENTDKTNQAQDFSKAVEWYEYVEEILDEDEEMPEEVRKRINDHMLLGWGYLYEYGYGVKQDYKKAMEYYEMLADSNNAMGYFRHGLMYYYGKGVSVDYKILSDLLLKIGDDLALEDEMIFMYDQNDLHTSYYQKKTMHCTRKKSVLGGEGCYYMGLMHKYGQGIPKDEDKFNFYFNAALSLGCERAKNEIKDY